jgi:aryl-alcohol dehydrogenase-like predicted oxidoreductase
VIFGARNAQQLRENLGAVDWALSPEHMALLNAASETALIYPYWHQASFKRHNPFLGS